MSFNVYYLTPPPQEKNKRVAAPSVHSFSFELHLQSPDFVHVSFDFVLQIFRSLASIKLSKVKFVIWSSDMSLVALISKHGELYLSLFNSTTLLISRFP